MDDLKCVTKYCRNPIEVKYLGEWLCAECWKKKARGDIDANLSKV